MASTFSPILRIELIGTGDQSGTWGNTTNINLGTLIEQAIAGTAIIDVTSGDVTLTDYNGTTDEARCAALRIIGTPGVSRNVVAPAVSKIYVVANGSDAAIVLKTSTSTGLTVPAGEVYLAYYDSTSVEFRLVGRASATTNTPNTLVLRDASGNFSAGLITATGFSGPLNGTVGAGTPASGAFTTLATSGNTTLGNTLTANSSVGTAGQVLTSRGAGLSPTWGAAIVSGMIMMWSGSIASIPAGWLLCDGTNSTPDLRNKFIVGAGSTYAVNATGGSADAITVAHTHSTTVTDPGHTHVQQNNGADVDTGSTSAGPNTSGSYYGPYTPVQASVTTQSGITGISVAVNSTGSSGTNANLPPYFALAYIMKS